LSEKLEKGDVIKKEQKEKIISLYLLCVFCLSRLCLSVRVSVIEAGEKKPGWREGAKNKIFSSWKDRQQNSRNLLFLLTYLHQTKTTQQTKQNNMDIVFFQLQNTEKIHMRESKTK